MGHGQEADDEDHNVDSAHFWKLEEFLLKMGQSRPFFVYFRPFLITMSIIQIEKSVDGVLGIRTRWPQDAD